MMRSSIAVTAATIATTLALLGAPAGAQQSPSQSGSVGAAALPLIAHRPSSDLEISLDGRVDEAVWAEATAISDFTQQEPVEGAQPSERTEIRVVYDDDNLYIGAIIYDDPAGILAFQRQRDAGLNTDDRFMWIIDTFLDGRTGYFFEINAAGLMGDGVITGGGGGGGGGFGGFGGPGGGGGGTNKAWNGIWEARTFIRPDGWSAEIQIPFRTLNFNPGQTEWGINFQRTIRRKNEEIMWRGFRRSQGLRNPVFAGRLTGLSGMSQGLGLEARPSTVANWRNIPTDADRNTYPKDISLDLNYSVTSSLRASVSVNTDFAEVESDQRRVNLTRFPIRFPERRDFFLEGSGVFSFAPSSGPSPFYSREIGIKNGQQVPLNFGTRLTGQAGPFELGFYQIGTGRHEYFDTNAGAELAFPREMFTVARVKRQLFEQSAIGAIYTRRGTSADAVGFAPIDQHTAGIDLDMKTRNFMGNHNLELEAFVAWNSNPLAAADPSWSDLGFGDLSSRGARLNFPNDLWSGHVSYREFGDAYDPAIGFVTRNNFRRVEPRVGWSPRPSGIPWIRKLDFSAQFRAQTELGTGVLEEREWQFNLLGIDFESGDGLDIQATNTFEYLDRTFEVSDGILVAPGNYSNWEYQLMGRSAGRRRVSLNGSASISGFWDGDRKQTQARISFRPNPGISLSTNFEYNDVTMPTGSFTAALYELGADWNPNPRVSLTNQLQYDDVSELVGLFARLRWIVKPGNDVYLVYTHNWQYQALDILDPDQRDLITLSRGASVKLNYTYRF
ncbi:MAG: carbohydrate binding family 9 domain-containing protein [Gemmatimonadetes bacterium]|nr:carbohydrate binding family 9 domain-containing protein [Gemmatimonadota bacterium]MDA1102216.1 carbohydrate binding family 9 domain-containing protein [Gemmatimonadota bacterium]